MEAAPEEIVCGPQSPRDISVAGGTNTVPVPQGETPNLCNVHFHKPFEHAGLRWTGDAPEPSGEAVCESVDYGDRVELHWVYTNCELPEPPRPGLENCVCDRDDMVLRVYARGYVVSDEGTGPEQPTEGLVRYLGSTTGPSYDNQVCSPARVNWAVDPEVGALRKEALANWCETNPWEGEDHPHGSRPLVTREDWLSPFAP